MPTFARTLTLTIGDTATMRANGSPCQFASRDFHAMLAIFSGHTLECQVYSPTNIVFYADAGMIRDAWKAMDKEKFYWVNLDDIATCIIRYGKGKEGKLAMSLPNRYCVQTPKEIETMMDLKPIRVTCSFHGRQAGALGVGYRIEGVRRTIRIPVPFTEKEAQEMAREALYQKVDGMAYERVSNVHVTFN